MLGLEVLFFCYYRYKRAMLQVSSTVGFLVSKF